MRRLETAPAGEMHHSVACSELRCGVLTRLLSLLSVRCDTSDSLSLIISE